MADFNKLKDTIRGAIYPNGRGAISADKHQAALLEMADTMQETDSKVTELSEEVYGAYTKITDFSVYEKYNMGIANHYWYVDDSVRSILIPVLGGVRYRIVGSSTDYWYMSLLKSKSNMQAGYRADICTLMPIENATINSKADRYSILKNQVIEFTIPQDCTYIWIQIGQGTVDTTPKSIETIGEKALRDEIADLKQQYRELSENGGVLIITPTIEDGVLVLPTGETVISASSCATDYVYVGDSPSVVIEGAYMEYDRSIAAFDKNKIFVSAWADYTNGEHLLIPSGVEYIRITGEAGVAPTVIKQERVAFESRIELLKKGLNNVESEIQTINGLVSDPILSTIINWRYSISAQGWINEGSSILFDIEGRNEWIGKAGQPTYYAFLNSFDFEKIEGIFNESTPIPALWTTNKELQVAIPSDAKYLWVQLASDSASPVDIPEYLIVDGIVCEFDGTASPQKNLSAQIIDNSQKIDSLLKSKQISASFLDFSDVIVCSHRGMSAVDCPENSLHSITTAAYQQMKIVECDVQYTSDGVPVVLHDDTLNRTMNTIQDEEITEPINVSNLTWNELSQGYIYKTSVERYKTRICTFDEWLNRVRQLKLIPLLHYVDVRLIKDVQDYVGDNFIYMGNLSKCLEVRKLAPSCFIMYQYAAQQDSTGEITDVDAVIADMHSIGGLCGYSSIKNTTFSDGFIKKLRENGFYWQYSTETPYYATDYVSRGVDFLLINNWCNNHLTYRPLFNMNNNLNAISYSSLENGCPVLEEGESFSLNLQANGNNLRVHIVCKGQVQVKLDNLKSRFGNNEHFVAYTFGVNTIHSEIGVTISAHSRLVIEELYIEES